MDDYHITYEDDPEESAWGIIGRGIGAYNTQHAGDQRHQYLCYVLRGPDEEIVGGVMAATYYDWLYIDLLWVREDLRGAGAQRTPAWTPSVSGAGFLRETRLPGLRRAARFPARPPALLPDEDLVVKIML